MQFRYSCMILRRLVFISIICEVKIETSTGQTTTPTRDGTSATTAVEKLESESSAVTTTIAKNQPKSCMLSEEKLKENNIGNMTCDQKMTHCTMVCKESYHVSGESNKVTTQTTECNNGNLEKTPVCKESSIFTTTSPISATTSQPTACSLKQGRLKRNNLKPFPSCDRTNAGSSCIVYCKQNYKINQAVSSNISCSNDGKWIGGIPTCKEIKCAKFKTGLKQTVQTQKCSSQSLNSTCQVKCEDGYKFSSPPEQMQESTCELSSDKVSATWSSVSTCEAIQCEDVKNGNFKFNCTGRSIDDWCSIQCSKGYEFSDKTLSKHVTCNQENNVGKWMPAIKDCQKSLISTTTSPPSTTTSAPIVCSLRPRQLNRNNLKPSPSCDRTNAGSSCIIYCKQNYKINQAVSSNISCSNDGNWIGGIPTCTAPDSGIKTPKTSTDGNKLSVVLEAVDERNGPVSCYFVVVQRVNGSMNTSEGISDISLLRQANEMVEVGDYYIAIAVKRFTSEITVALRDGKFSCCNVRSSSNTCDLGPKARERQATTTDVVTASNNPLEPGTTYRHYVLITTPGEHGLETFFTASPFSEPWTYSFESGVVSRTNVTAIILPVAIGIILVAILLGILIYRRQTQYTKKAEAATARKVHGRLGSGQAPTHVIYHAGDRGRDYEDGYEVPPSRSEIGTRLIKEQEDGSYTELNFSLPDTTYQATDEGNDDKNGYEMLNTAVEVVLDEIEHQSLEEFPGYSVCMVADTCRNNDTIEGRDYELVHAATPNKMLLETPGYATCSIAVNDEKENAYESTYESSYEVI